jgi:TolB protein
MRLKGEKMQSASALGEYSLRIIRIFILLLPFFLFNPQSALAQGRVYIDIDSPAFQRFTVAITDFQKLGLPTPGDDLSNWFSDSLGRYLEMTGFVRLIPARAHLEDQTLFPYSRGRVSFADWTVIGAEYLIKGGFSRTGRNLIAEFRLYDVVKGSRLMEKRYTGLQEERREMIRKMARDITETLTGDGSVFDTKIAFVAKRGQSSDVYTIHFDGTGLTRITNYQSVVLSPRWSPDGQAIGYTSYKEGNPDLYLRRLQDYRTLKLSGFRGLNLLGGWSPDGRSLLLTLSKDGNEDIYRMDLGSGRLTRLTHDFSIDVSPSCSPDGRHIAFVSNRSGSPQVYIMDEDGGRTRRLTFEGNYNTSPCWSPDGRRIAYEGMVNGRFRIFSINENGGTPFRIGPEIGDNESPSWSPDGRYLVFSQRGHGPGKICIMNANGTNIRVLYENPFGCISPVWSPHLKP